MTAAEKVFWEKVRKRRFKGYRFIRQHPITYKLLDKTLNYFIVDFYCYTKKLMVKSINNNYSMIKKEMKPCITWDMKL